MASKHKNPALLTVMMVLLLMNEFSVEAAPSLVNIGVGTNGKTVVINARLSKDSLRILKRLSRMESP